jgi:heme exporter protein D
MIWNSWNDFFAMGGYGLYVWGSFIVVIVCMVGEIVLLQLRWKAIRQRMKRWMAASSMEGK